MTRFSILYGSRAPWLPAGPAEESGTSLTEIFSLYGQAAYRRYERRALERVLGSHERAVIAVGGSLVTRAVELRQSGGSRQAPSQDVHAPVPVAA